MLLTPECTFQSLTPAVIRHQNASPLYWANWVVLHGLRFLAWVGACFVDIFCVRIYTCVYIYTDMTHISLSIYLPIYLIRLSIYLSTIYLSIYRRIYPLPSGLIHGKPRETLVQPGFGQLVGATFNLNCATHCKGRL